MFAEKDGRKNMKHISQTVKVLVSQIDSPTMKIWIAVILQLKKAQYFWTLNLLL